MQQAIEQLIRDVIGKVLGADIRDSAARERELVQAAAREIVKRVSPPQR